MSNAAHSPLVCIQVVPGLAGDEPWTLGNSFVDLRFASVGNYGTATIA